MNTNGHTRSSTGVEETKNLEQRAIFQEEHESTHGVPSKSFFHLSHYTMRILVFTCALLGTLGAASETDSFTHLSLIMNASFPAINAHLNAITNHHISIALSSLSGCDYARLEQALVSALGDLHVLGVSTLQSPLEIELNHNTSLPVIHTHPNEHVYGDFSPLVERVLFILF
jgi:hypothetical protein